MSGEGVAERGKERSRFRRVSDGNYFDGGKGNAAHGGPTAIFRPDGERAHKQFYRNGNDVVSIDAAIAGSAGARSKCCAERVGVVTIGRNAAGTLCACGARGSAPAPERK